MESSQKSEASQTETRYDLLKKASLEHYNTGISLKNAAKKHNVGIRELKEFYENEAAEFLEKKGDNNTSDEDP